MLSRHFLRSKVLQALYAHCVKGELDAAQARRAFDYNISRLNELGALQLIALVKVVEAGRNVIEDGLKKMLPTEEDLNPTYLIVDNPLMKILANNHDFQRINEKFVFPWDLHEDIFRDVYNRFRKSNRFKEYMRLEERSCEDHQQMCLNMFKQLINTPDFRELFADRSLLWEDDFDQVAQYNFSQMKGADACIFSPSSHIQAMMDERVEVDQEALRFCHTLIDETLSHIQENEQMIRKHLVNWDFDRVALMDILIINMGISELTACPSIPERVTVDECIELAKDFSADKSKIFVNGIIDKIIHDLRSSGRINKSGRGLFVPGVDDKPLDDNSPVDVVHFS